MEFYRWSTQFTTLLDWLLQSYYTEDYCCNNWCPWARRKRPQGHLDGTTLFQRNFHWAGKAGRMQNVSIRRCYHSPQFGPVTRAELHAFSDASQGAIDVAVFLRLFSYKEDDSVPNVFGQAKVAPINPIRIPRLEPCGAVLAVQAVDSLRITKEIAMEISETVFYTDSKVALGYICNESRRFHIYVANRVQTIRKISSPNQWRYVESSVNPSDLATRGLDP